MLSESALDLLDLVEGNEEERRLRDCRLSLTDFLLAALEVEGKMVDEGSGPAAGTSEERRLGEESSEEEISLHCTVLSEDKESVLDSFRGVRGLVEGHEAGSGAGWKSCSGARACSAAAEGTEERFCPEEAEELGNREMIEMRGLEASTDGSGSGLGSSGVVLVTRAITPRVPGWSGLGRERPALRAASSRFLLFNT